MNSRVDCLFNLDMATNLGEGKLKPDKFHLEIDPVSYPAHTE